MVGAERRAKIDGGIVSELLAGSFFGELALITVRSRGDAPPCFCAWRAPQPDPPARRMMRALSASSHRTSAGAQPCVRPPSVTSTSSPGDPSSRSSLSFPRRGTGLLSCLYPSVEVVGRAGEPREEDARGL